MVGLVLPESQALKGLPFLQECHCFLLSGFAQRAAKTMLDLGLKNGKSSSQLLLANSYCCRKKEVSYLSSPRRSQKKLQLTGVFSNSSMNFLSWLHDSRKGDAKEHSGTIFSTCYLLMCSNSPSLSCLNQMMMIHRYFHVNKQ